MGLPIIGTKRNILFSIGTKRNSIIFFRGPFSPDIHEKRGANSITRIPCVNERMGEIPQKQPSQTFGYFPKRIQVFRFSQENMLASPTAGQLQFSAKNPERWWFVPCQRF